MTYQELIETVSLIVETPKIQKKGLTLYYELNETDHMAIQAALYQKTNPYSTSFIPNDEFEVMIVGILVKFKKLKN